jgi:hypothetical protein
MQHNHWSNVDPSSFTSDDQRPLQRRRPHVDTSSSDSGDMRATNLLSLPHTPESCRCQALKANVSCFDVAALCDPHYHGGPNGLSILTIPDTRARGYMSITSDNVMLCFNDIISMHLKVLASWTNTRTQHSGPSVEHIVEKAVLTILPKLNGLTSVELVLFYDNLQKISSVYLLPLMPFNAINLRLGFEGLCPPVRLPNTYIGTQATYDS